LEHLAELQRVFLGRELETQQNGAKISAQHVGNNGYMHNFQFEARRLN